MANINVPAIDQSVAGDWTEQDINLYNQMPFYLVERQIQRRKDYAVWPKVTGKANWQPNKGPIMRSVRKEPSPHVRSFAFPVQIHQTPLKDTIGHKEVKSDAVVRWQDFESLVFSFVPDFRDFMTNHISFASDDINEKILRFNDVFIRTEIFMKSPVVMLGNNLDDGAPIGDGNVALNASGSKNLTWLSAKLQTITNTGLGLTTLANLANIASEDLDIPHFQGDSTGPADSQTGKYRLILSGEARRMWQFDPYLLTNRPLAEDIVGAKYKKTPFDDVVALLERHPIRFAMDGEGAVTVPAPQTTVVEPTAANYGETVPNPLYTAAEYEVAFLCGAGAYDSIAVGMPPKTFTSGYEPSNFKKMRWNGEVILTKDIINPLSDGSGNVLRYETNNRGRWLQLLGTLACGVSAYQPRYIIPIIFKRKRRVV